LSSTEKTYPTNEFGVVELSNDANLALQNNAKEFRVALLKTLDLDKSIAPTVIGPLTDLFMGLSREFASQSERYWSDLQYNIPASIDAYLAAVEYDLNGVSHVCNGALMLAFGAYYAALHIQAAASHFAGAILAIASLDFEGFNQHTEMAVDEAAIAGDQLQAGEQWLIIETRFAMNDITASLNPTQQGVTLTTYIVIDVVCFPTFAALAIACAAAAIVCALIEGSDLQLQAIGVSLDDFLVGEAAN
jgi:hypothetical protein